ncbi:hypothetical protein [Azospirillum picis]|uniref:Uncharacterized protein n=1 Tax=Azospirillum picis TaxID=488438 RepID=A0ABU0MM44_9PROT|nr:hypothetical protein [Azospirillum picis]MBP2300578.1 hypothetical protein [Azospirillum picis]MDQ0534547.1 hypothetical protein [Azospirillum picis]
MKDEAKRTASASEAGEAAVISESPGKSSATRLYAILARNARTGVIFRRGPSRHVQLIRWDLRDDTFEHGQWFKGRIYERRCDLSPSGRLLVYFAATYRPPYGSWTALSVPPCFTALTLWPKGDGWGGGGMFEDEKTLLLNHRMVSHPNGFELAEGFRLAAGMQVKPLGERSGGGEDNPVNWCIRSRDGWRMVAEGKGRKGGRRAGAFYTFEAPQIVEKEGVGGRRLQELLHAIGRRKGAWYDLTHRVLDRDGRVLVDLPGSDWADWDGGDLVFARDGCLYRLPESHLPESHLKNCEKPEAEASRLLHDFRNARFTSIRPTEKPS